MVPLLRMEVELAATAEDMEEDMETHPDQAANPPGGKLYSYGSTALPWASRLVDGARGGTFARLAGNLTLPLAFHSH